MPCSVLQHSAAVRNQHYDEAVDLDGDDSMDDSIDTHANALSQSAASPLAAAKGSRGGRSLPTGSGGANDSPPAGSVDNIGGHGEYASDVEIPGFKAAAAVASTLLAGPSSQHSGGGGGMLGSPSPIQSPAGGGGIAGLQPTGASAAAGSGGGGGGGSAVLGAPGMAPPGGSTANPGVSGVPPKKGGFNPGDWVASGIKVADEVGYQWCLT
jgi:hypothetical protein